MSDHPQIPRRRDLLTTTAIWISAAAGMFALWPMFAALGPDAEKRARQNLFNIGTLHNLGYATVNVSGKPVLVFKRSQEELRKLEANLGKHVSSTDWRASWHRSLKPEIMVCYAVCTFDACVINRSETYFGAQLQCPCCASRYNLAGRRQSGPAPTDLQIPNHRYISAAEIEFE